MTRTHEQREYNRTYQIAWRKANREKVKAISRKSRQKRNDAQKRRVREVRNASYMRNKVMVSARQAASHARRSDEFFAFKQLIGCARCGFCAHGAALEFHHLDPATKSCHVSVFNWRNDVGKAEIKKCIVLCANCHRVETVAQRRTGRTE